MKSTQLTFQNCSNDLSSKENEKATKFFANVLSQITSYYEDAIKNNKKLVIILGENHLCNQSLFLAARA